MLDLLLQVVDAARVLEKGNILQPLYFVVLLGQFAPEPFKFCLLLRGSLFLF